MDIETLNKSDGQQSQQILVAYDGKIYDVSESALWQEGIHMCLHKAGQDLSEHMPMAPHGSEVLDRFPMIGELTTTNNVKPDPKRGLKKGRCEHCSGFSVSALSVCARGVTHYRILPVL